MLLTLWPTVQTPETTAHHPVAVQPVTHVEFSVVLEWEVRAGSRLSLSLVYDVRQRTLTERSLAFDVRGRRTIAVAAGWQVRSRLSSQNEQRWCVDDPDELLYLL